MFHRPVILWWMVVIGVSTGVTGCTLLQQGWIALKGNEDESRAVAENTVLKPLGAPRTAIQVEVVFVERPAGDPLMGEALWRELDQVGALDLPIREGLKRNGFRIGISSSSPPRSLQTLLGLAIEIPDASSSEDAKRLVGRRIALTSGSETEIQTSPLFESCSVTSWNGESSAENSYQNARCLFRLKAQKVQDGWAKLELIPEIHHGDNRLRHTATTAGWGLKTTQEMEPFYAQKFELTLNQGEIAVVAPMGDDRKTLGSHFFVGNEKGEKVQRVLIVRLADMGKADPVYAQ